MTLIANIYKKENFVRFFFFVVAIFWLLYLRDTEMVRKLLKNIVLKDIRMFEEKKKKN